MPSIDGFLLSSFEKLHSLSTASVKISAISIHPGWVQTDMGGKNAPLTAQQSIQGVLEVLENFQEDYNGKFFDNNGEELPW